MPRLGSVLIGVFAVLFGAATSAWAQWSAPTQYPSWPEPAPGYSYEEAPEPPAVTPYWSTPSENPDDYRVGPDSYATRRLVSNPTGQPPGTIVVDTRVRKLYLVLNGGTAIEYGIGVGRQGFEWKGVARVGRKAEWPTWTPPAQMLERRPDLPTFMEGGLDNPLGARALYLFKGKVDTLFRIHGTNEPDTIGQAVSSGCIRMMNADVIDLYRRVPIGTRVVVL